MQRYTNKSLGADALKFNKTLESIGSNFRFLIGTRCNHSVVDLAIDERLTCYYQRNLKTGSPRECLAACHSFVSGETANMLRKKLEGKAMKMKLGKIYRAAAEHHDKGEEEFSCHSINRVQHLELVSPNLALRTYEKIFSCNYETFDGFYKELYLVYPSEEELREIRVLALCLAAAMADAGDLPVL